MSRSARAGKDVPNGHVSDDGLLTARIYSSVHLVTDRCEVVEVDHRLSGQPWVEFCRFFCGAVEKSNQHLAVAGYSLCLDDKAERTALSGQVTQTAKEKERRTHGRTDGRDLNLDDGGSRQAFGLGQDNVHLGVAESLRVGAKVLRPGRNDRKHRNDCRDKQADGPNAINAAP